MKLISSHAEMHDMQTKTVFLHILPLLYILQQLKFPIQNLQWAAEEEAGIRLRESLNLIFCDSIMSGINSEQESYEGSKKKEEEDLLPSSLIPKVQCHFQQLSGIVKKLLELRRRQHCSVLVAIAERDKHENVQSCLQGAFT